jgi:hypothetical protein
MQTTFHKVLQGCPKVVNNGFIKKKKPVAVCDQFIFLAINKLESENLRKTINISINLFFQTFCSYFIKVSRVFTSTIPGLIGRDGDITLFATSGFAFTSS